MELGILSCEIKKDTITEAIRDAHEKGFTAIQLFFYQFTKEYATFPSEKMPDVMTVDMAEEARRAAKKYGVKISGVGGFFNMVSRDLNVRNKGLYDLEKLASLCGVFDCNIIGLCTGTRAINPNELWDINEENNTVQAWHDICETTAQALTIAEHYNVNLGIEIDPSNVINTPEKARRLIDTMQSKNLKIILDGANLFKIGTAYKEVSRDILAHAFDLLGSDIIMAHGKDVKHGPGLDATYAGNGIVDFDYMLNTLKRWGFRGDMILHGAKTEEEVCRSYAFMKKKIEETGI